MHESTFCVAYGKAEPGKEGIDVDRHGIAAMRVRDGSAGAAEGGTLFVPHPTSSL
ncbi:hypothetical protein ACIQF8_17275 [Pseudarthrobacter sp. NPDC092184]|uniref:hypothetical protein n=1 Tax=Pseudarthrobacter sp. NPDC092184 TaxID=3364410 RepID=UPI00382DD41B